MKNHTPSSKGDTSDRCKFSNRADGKHSWKFDGDDPYVLCYYCDEIRDALSNRVIRQGKGNDMPSYDPKADIEATSNAPQSPSATTKSLEEIIDTFFSRPYPNYNMGLLPDEEGYDAVQERRNYEEDYARAIALAAINNYTKEAVIKELERVYDNINTGNVYLALGKVKTRISELKGGIDELRKV